MLGGFSPVSPILLSSAHNSHRVRTPTVEPKRGEALSSSFKMEPFADLFWHHALYDAHAHIVGLRRIGNISVDLSSFVLI